MKKIIVSSLILMFGFLCSCDTLLSLTGNTTLSSMSQTELGKAVKELLTNSSDNALAKVGVANGFFKNSEIKIPFPQALSKVETTLKNVGFGSQVDQFTEKLNRSAEDASAGVKEIFIAAINQLTINDAVGIITGADDAATQYFKRTTTNLLKSKISPVVEKSNQKIKLASYWTPLATKYNTVMALTGGNQVNTDLTAYVTEKAIEGIFNIMAKEEKTIRTKTSAQTSSLLQRVFGTSGSTTTGSATSTATTTSGSTATKTGGSSTGKASAKPATATSSSSTTSGSGTVVKSGSNTGTGTATVKKK